jgi:hypothetical protein
LRTELVIKSQECKQHLEEPGNPPTLTATPG